MTIAVEVVSSLIVVALRWAATALCGRWLGVVRLAPFTRIKRALIFYWICALNARVWCLLCLSRCAVVGGRGKCESG